MPPPSSLFFQTQLHSFIPDCFTSSLCSQLCRMVGLGVAINLCRFYSAAPFSSHLSLVPAVVLPQAAIIQDKPPPLGFLPRGYSSSRAAPVWALPQGSFLQGITTCSSVRSSMAISCGLGSANGCNYFQ